MIVGSILFAAASAEAQLTMNAGDTYVYHFDSLQYQGTAIVPPAAGYFNLLFDNSTVDSGDSLRMEIFEGLALGSPVAERLVTPGSEVAFLQSDTAWADKEGTIRVTAVAGTFTINQVDITRKDNAPGGIDIYHLRFTPVPEPSTIALGAFGAAALLYRRRQ